MHSFYRRARLSGLWDKILEHLVKLTRKNAGRAENPSYAVIDFQSVKNTYVADQRGFDGEKTKGTKRQIATDTLGCLLGVVVHRANPVDTTMGIWSAMVASCAYPAIKRFCADKGYRGTFIYDAYALLHCCVDISANIKSGKRWVAERTFAWLNNLVA